MFFWVIQQVILSLILIILVHYIYIFFKNNLTTPKVRDLVNKPINQYDEIYKSMLNHKTDKESDESKVTMKTELKNYLQELSREPNAKDPAFSNPLSPPMGQLY